MFKFEFDPNHDYKKDLETRKQLLARVYNNQLNNIKKFDTYPEAYEALSCFTVLWNLSSSFDGDYDYDYDYDYEVLDHVTWDSESSILRVKLGDNTYQWNPETIKWEEV